MRQWFSRFYFRVIRSNPELKRWLEFLHEMSSEAVSSNTMNIDAAKGLFKKHIRIVEIEPHSFCNRTCSFCPNSKINRRAEKFPFPSSLYDRILNDLSCIGYDRQLRFSRYCEPLAYRGIFNMIKQANEKCPGIQVMIISNGDYLSESMLKDLREVGLSRLHISIYLSDEEKWTVEAALNAMEAMKKKIRVSLEKRFIGGSIFESYKSPVAKGLSITCNCVNYKEVGFDRGGSMEALSNPNYIRSSPCIQVFQNMTVDYDGTVMPCCNLRSDDPNQERFKLGKIEDRKDTVFSVYVRNAAEWRSSLAGFGPKNLPCRSCKQLVPSEKLIPGLQREWKRYFEGIGHGSLTT